jgi:hypothetical protein
VELGVWRGVVEYLKEFFGIEGIRHTVSLDVSYTFLGTTRTHLHPSLDVLPCGIQRFWSFSFFISTTTTSD